MESLKWVWFTPGGYCTNHMAGASSYGSAFEHFVDSAVRGFHVYKESWTPLVHEELKTKQEHGNSTDQFAVAVYKESTPAGGSGTANTVGHLPKEISRVCWYFIEHDGEILCTITNDRKQRCPLEQGGLEIPCQLKFIGKKKNIKKLKKMLL